DDLRAFPGNHLEALAVIGGGNTASGSMTSIGSASCGRTAKRSTSRSWTTTDGGTMPRKARRLPPVHPGEILREDLLKPLGISINRLGRDLRVPVTRMSEIVNGRRGVTADTALRLARYFGTTPERSE